jgi:O-antigen ligase
MNDVLKLLGPLLFLAYFFHKILRERNLSFGCIGVLFFFTSIVSFSQNFTFVYRELHQITQLGLAFLFFCILLQRKTLTIVVIPLFIFAIFIVLSLIANEIDADAISQTINFTVVVLTTLFLYSVISDREDLFYILKFIGELGCIAGILAIVEFLTHGSSRVEATFANPNYLALYLGLSFVCVYYFFDKHRSAFLLIILLAILLTGSRAALLIPALVYIKVLLSDDFSYKKILFIFSGVILIGAIALSGKSRIGGEEMSGSDAERLLFAKIAYNMTADNPWFGVGWGRFIDEFSLYSTNVKAIKLQVGVVDASSQERRVTHNDLLRISSELGIVPFLIVLIFLAWNMCFLAFNKNHSFDFLFAIWFGFLFFSLTHNNLNTAFSWFFILMPYFIVKNNWVKE